MRKLFAVLLIFPVLLLLVGCGSYPVTEKSDVEIMNEVMLLQVSDIPAPEPEPESEEQVEEEQPGSVEEVEQSVQEQVVEEVLTTKTAVSYSGSDFKRDGVWCDERFRYTWYSSNVKRHYRTDEWTPDSQGIYRDSDGYAVVASNDYPQGTVIEGTLFGAAKVYDYGCDSGTLDVYVNF
jgi:hypothetical protein